MNEIILLDEELNNSDTAECLANIGNIQMSIGKYDKALAYLNQALDIDSSAVAKYFITQININSLRATMDILGEPHDKAHTVMHHYGYTGSACIPMALNDAWEKELVKKGDLIYFIGSGGGLAFASAAFRL